MDVKAHLLEADLKESPAYARAKMLLNEKRELLRKLSEVNRELRHLNNEDTDAVTAAISETPVRNPHGRPLQIRTSAK